MATQENIVIIQVKQDGRLGKNSSTHGVRSVKILGV